MTRTPCWLNLDGWRLAVVERRKKYARVWLVDGSTHRLDLKELVTHPCSEETGHKLMRRLGL